MQVPDKTICWGAWCEVGENLSTHTQKNVLLEVGGLGEGVIGRTRLSGGDGVLVTVVGRAFARQEVVSEESLSGHDGEVTTSERRPSVDD